MKRRDITISKALYLSGLSLMLLGLPTSRFLMSISQFLLLGAWVIYGIEQIAASGIKPGLMWPLRVVENRFGCFFRQREAIIFILIFLLHGIGLLWTSDLPFGLHDLRIKLPLLLLPIVFSTLPA
ncbi:MAG: hypothetical protein M0O94_01670, partial [Bacteroidales bacterium]|nr:hypothetical protein [Bacteroidales bacterium]MDY0285709.1 hypothetical protein [Bacteroidales bacterium]